MLQSTDSDDEVLFDATQGLMERLEIEAYEVSMVIPIRNLVNVALRECWSIGFDCYVVIFPLKR